ncbi:MAG: class I SAM-dependent methyltransferase [Isosphaeraceae bacterium]|nr:class I SAM-dependent methyltransferase [Isosphaeraceae bacterium]
MTLSSYDEVPYPSYPFPETQPAHLATVARLFGVPAPAPDVCRVLELGCAAGGNLIPLAVAWPRASFIGIDLSGYQIAEGRERVRRLGLDNIELRHGDLSDLDSGAGTFDYIICHGVYSWVARSVQERILAVSRDHLTPHGVAYVSYNTYPGWHLMSAIRDMMLYHAGRFAAPSARVTQARAFLDFLARWSPARDDAYGALLRAEAASLRQKSDAYLYHEHLEAVNDPIYFAEFVRRAERAGLSYLAETQVRVMLASDLPPEVQESLRLLAPDVLDLEQYLDFLRNRTFRRTLLCRTGGAIDRSLGGTAVEAMYVACTLRPELETVDLAEGVEAWFVDPGGGRLRTTDRVMKGLLLTLGACWPRATPTAELRREMAACLAPLDEAVRRELGSALSRRLVDYYLHGVIELHVVPPPVGIADERAEASPLARLQAAESDRVTNLRHQVMALTVEERRLLPMLDGTRTIAELAPQSAADAAAAVRQLAAKSLLLPARWH